jgi:hypothetical protein
VDRFSPLRTAGLEAFSGDTPNPVSRESLIAVLDAFLAGYELRKGPRKIAQLEQHIKAAVIVPYDLDLCKEFARVKASLDPGKSDSPEIRAAWSIGPGDIDIRDETYPILWECRKAVYYRPK